MGRIPDQEIDDILNRLDIVDVISQYVSLKRSGRNFKARCPFHNEKSASFMVSQEKQIWHCFGCGIGGNLFSFVMRVDSLSFPEAARLMAEKAGVRLSQDPVNQVRTDHREKLFEANDRAVHFFQENLKQGAEGAQARQYLLKRGIDDTTRDLFRLGWAPRARGAFSQWAQRQGLSRQKLIQAGLVSAQKEGQDYFHGRLMFPIADVRGRVIAFGARVLDKTLPKYINSPDSELFHKSRTLYGIQATGPEIRKTRHVIFVEGYMDLLMLYQHGVRNVTATLGTALTTEHARAIRRFADDCTLVFDADSAGQEAMLRGAEVLMAQDLGVKVLRLPNGKDPDDLVRSQGPEAFIKWVAQAQDLFDFKMRVMIERHGTRDVRAQWKVVSSLIPTLDSLENAVVRAGYIRRLASTLSLPEESIQVELNRARRRVRKPISVEQKPVASSTIARTHPEERILVGLMLGDEEAISFIKEHLAIEDFRHPDYRVMTEMIFQEASRGGSCQPAALIRTLESPKLESLVTCLSAEAQNFSDRPQMMEDCIKRVKENQRRTFLTELKNRIRQADEASDDVLRRQLLSEFQKVQGAP